MKKRSQIETLKAIGQRQTDETFRTVSFLMIVSLLLAPSPASASVATNLSGVICNISDNLTPYVNFISAIFYVAGAFLLANGVLQIKQHGESPGQMPLSRGVMHVIAGAASLSLPEIAGIVQETMGVTTSGGNGLTACSPLATTAVTASSSMDVLFTNLFNNIATPLQTLISILSVVVGAVFVGKGLLKAAKYGTDPRAASVQAIVANLFIGAALLAFGQLVDILMVTVFGIESSAVTYPAVNWSSISGSTSTTGIESANKVFKAVLVFIQVIGIISFFRGWLIIKAAVEGGQGTIPQGVTHIIGGVMAINVGGMAVILNNTFGLKVIS